MNEATDNQTAPIGQPTGKRRTQQIDAGPIKHLIEANDLTVPSLAEQFGVATSTLHHWLANNSAPRWTLLACEGLARRWETTRNEPAIYVVRVAPDKAEAFEMLAGVIGNVTMLALKHYAPDFGKDDSAS